MVGVFTVVGLLLNPCRAVLSPSERDLLSEVFDVCGGVRKWSTFTTHSSFDRTLSREGAIYRTEEEDTVVQFQKMPEENYAAYVKANRRDVERTYLDESKRSYVSTINRLSLEIVQGGEFLLKVVHASDKYFGNALRQFGSGWFKPSDSQFYGRLPMGGQFADHVSLGLGKPTNLREINLESVKEISDKDVDGVPTRCIEVNFKSDRSGQMRSITFCFAEGNLKEVTERIDSKPDRMGNPGAEEIHSTAIRTYMDINQSVDFPFEPAPFDKPGAKKRVDRTTTVEEEGQSRLEKILHSFWFYVVVFGVGLVILALILLSISHSKGSKGSSRVSNERMPLLGANNPVPVESETGPPLLI